MFWHQTSCPQKCIVLEKWMTIEHKKDADVVYLDFARAFRYIHCLLD